MKKSLLLTSITALMLGTSIANANNTNSATTGIFVGGNLGYASVSTPNLAENISDDFGDHITRSQSDSHIAWGLNAGMNFALNPNLLLGFQTGYNNYGHTEYTTEYTINGNSGVSKSTLTTTAWDFLLTSTYVFDSGINLFAKAGSAYEITEIRSAANKAFRPEIAVGTGYMINNFNFTVEYRHIFADSSNLDNSGVPTVNAVLAGVSYQFSL